MMNITKMQMMCSQIKNLSLIEFLLTSAVTGIHKYVLLILIASLSGLLIGEPSSYSDLGSVQSQWNRRLQFSFRLALWVKLKLQIKCVQINGHSYLHNQTNLQPNTSVWLCLSVLLTKNWFRKFSFFTLMSFNIKNIFHEKWTWNENKCISLFLFLWVLFTVFICLAKIFLLQFFKEMGQCRVVF